MSIAVRSPAVAGTFYPADPAQLASSVDAMLDAAPVGAPGFRRSAAGPKALVAPHAGYVYSGPVAAYAYATLAASREVVRRVVLLGPAHRVRVAGLALPGVDALRTPLGDVPIDAEGVASIAQLASVSARPDAHAREHSLEVHLPFLQRTLASFSIVPLVVGDATPEAVAEVLRILWGGPETRIIVSSDLSHYLPYSTAKRVDEETANQIEALRLVEPDRACGARPLNGLCVAARERSMTAERLDLRNSGDTAGRAGGDQVVGYGSFALREP